MKYSGIGGQAVMEGIMMRNGDQYAVAVRKPDGEIEVKTDVYRGFRSRHAFTKWPFLRGVFAFLESMVLGIKCLMFSAEFIEEEDDPKKEKKNDSVQAKGQEEKKEGLSNAAMTMTLLLSLVLAIGIFSVLPTVLVNFLKNVVKSQALLAFIEGLVRLAIFIIYVAAISLMKDIRRTYMYHGSEHKCINCLEHGLELTVENVMKSSKEHKRCGTSFMFLVMAISILLFMVIRVEFLPLRILSRIVLIPVIASLSYEVLQFTGRHDNAFVDIISRPGMWIQALTTKEPTPDMVEVAIAAIEPVFDWKKYLEENFPS